MQKLSNLNKMSSNLIIAIVLFLIVGFAYWQGLGGGFFFDDSANFLEPSEIQLREFSLGSILNILESGKAGPLGRPISMLSFAINYYFSGFDPFWFKLTNLFFHAVNGVLVYLLLQLIFRASMPSRFEGSNVVLPALFVSALWIVSPIQLTSVLYVVQRMTSLSSMFVILALILHVSARQKIYTEKTTLIFLIMAWGLFFPLAIFSKETGVLFILYVAVYEATLHRNLTGKFDSFAKIYLAMLGGSGATLLIYLLAFPEAGLLQGYDMRSFTMFERVLTESRIVWVYVKMIYLPALSDFGLYHDDFIVSTSLLVPYITAFALCGLVASFFTAWLLRKIFPIMSFGILWFLIGHSLESTIFPLELMHEHRNYLPSLGLFLLVAPGLVTKKRNHIASNFMSFGVVVAVFVYFILITHLRADMYGDDFRRTQIEAGYRVESVRSQYEAGAVLANLYNQHREPMLMGLAKNHFERVVALDPADKLALIGLMQLDCLSTQLVQTEIYNELKRRLSKGKWTYIDRTVMHGIAEMSNEGKLCLTRNQVDELFVIALESKTLTAQDRSVVFSDYSLYLWLGQKDYFAARNILIRAVENGSDDVLNRMNLLQLFRFLGDKRNAEILLEDLNGRDLGRQDRNMVKKVALEMSSENVVGGENVKN